MVSLQERCGPANDVSDVEGDWLILDHTGRLKLQGHLVATGTIVISRDDGLSSTFHIATIQNSCSGESSVIEIEFHLLSLESLRWLIITVSVVVLPRMP